jgi:ABC-type thiamin/hydroxymethylpyrimidine transport system permease subunit
VLKFAGRNCAQDTYNPQFWTSSDIIVLLLSRIFFTRNFIFYNYLNNVLSVEDRCDTKHLQLELFSGYLNFSLLFWLHMVCTLNGLR